MMSLLFDLGKHVGAGGVEPDENALTHTVNFIRELEHYLRYETIPFALVTTDQDGFVVFEWCHRDRKLTITIEPILSDSTYLKSWGANMFDEMEDGAMTYNGLLDLFLWLNGHI